LNSFYSFITDKFENNYTFLRTVRNNEYKTSFTDIILFIKFMGKSRNINIWRLVGNEFRLKSDL